MLREQELVARLDNHLVTIENEDRRVTNLADAGFDAFAFEQTCKGVDALLEAEAKAALLISSQKLSNSRWRPEDVLEEAIHYRQEAGRVVELERRRSLGQRALDLVKLAHAMSIQPKAGAGSAAPLIIQPE